MHSLIDTIDTLITGPSIEPLDLDEAKKQLRFTSTSEDTLIDVWISAARQHFEEQTGRQLITATRERRFDAVPSEREIELPYPPLQSVVSVTYDDANGSPTARTMDAATYQVIAPAGPTCRRGRIVLVSGATWPSTAALRIQFVCGYGDAPGDVPELVKAALYWLVGNFHKFRAEVQESTNTSGTLTRLPLGAEAILRAFKWSALPSLHLTRNTWSSPWV